MQYWCVVWLLCMRRSQSPFLAQRRIKFEGCSRPIIVDLPNAATCRNIGLSWGLGHGACTTRVAEAPNEGRSDMVGVREKVRWASLAAPLADAVYDICSFAVRVHPE
jgi:hypothetical protein